MISLWSGRETFAQIRIRDRSEGPEENDQFFSSSFFFCA